MTQVPGCGGPSSGLSTGSSRDQRRRSLRSPRRSTTRISSSASWPSRLWPRAQDERGRKIAVPALVGALKDTKNLVRCRAAKSLVAWGEGATGVPAMIEILKDHGATDSQKDDRNSDRSAAIASLEKIGADAGRNSSAGEGNNGRKRQYSRRRHVGAGGDRRWTWLICPFSVQKLAPPHDEVRPTQCISTAYCYSGSSGFSTIPKKTGRRARCSPTMSSPDLPRRRSNGWRWARP